MSDSIRTRRLGALGWLGVAALGLIGLAAVGVAAAPSALLGHARHGFSHFRHGGHGHGGHALGEAHIGEAVAWVLDEVDASNEQVAAVTAIASAAAADLRGLHEDHGARRDALTAALVAADRNALEALRSAELATLESASVRLVAALAEAAEVLTPEQRQRLAEAHAEHHGHH